jgi:response regulator RpfG family c-di-GMP phosphodiesterase
MCVPGLTKVLSKVEVYAVLLAAVAHDVGHVGVNNAFLVKSGHALAVQYGEQSPLEKMHCAVLMEVRV